MLKMKYIKALRIFNKHIYHFDKRWCVIGKANLALQGIEIEPSQIGILIDFEDLNHFLCFFSKFNHTDIEELQNGEAKEFILYIENIEFLVCAEYLHGIYWQLNSDIVTIMVNNINIPCLSLKAERESYKKLGMTEKAKLISSCIISNL